MNKNSIVSLAAAAERLSLAGLKALSRRQLLELGILGALTHGATGWMSVASQAAAATSGPHNQGADWSSISPFLAGNFAPVKEERVEPNLKVIGALPQELSGTYLRNGPNPQFRPLNKYHWFDGDGMLHAIQLQDGQASYRNRAVRTRGLELELRARRALYQSMTESPLKCRAPLGAPRSKNTANTALLHHGGKLLALWEGGNPYEVHLPELETVGEYDFRGGLSHAFTAHPKVDPVSGELMTFGYRVDRTPYVAYSVFGPDHARRHTTPIPVPRAVMMHDFAITERYTVFMDLPEVFELNRVFRGQSPLVYRPELGARLGVLPRLGTSAALKWFEIEPCYVFHVLGAWEEGESLVLVACRYPRFPEALNFEGTDQRAASVVAHLHEWRLNLVSGKVSERALDDQPSEFPQLNPQRTSRQFRFGYALGRNGTSLVKFDLQTGRRLQVEQVGRCSEPMFVPHPKAQAEDEGWLVTLSHDEESGQSQLLVLDASRFDPEPVARVLLPVRVPYGFHALWVA